MDTITDKKYKYSVEMFKDGKWVKEYRIYAHPKLSDDEDLKDIKGKRKNAKYIAIIINGKETFFV